MCVVGKMSKDIGMGVRKGTMVSFVPTLFGYFLGIPSLYVFSFFKMFFCDLFPLFFVTCSVVRPPMSAVVHNCRAYWVSSL